MNRLRHSALLAWPSGVTAAALTALISCGGSAGCDVDDDPLTPDAVSGCGDPVDPDEDLGTGADPEAGNFTLAEALTDLPEGPGPLRAIITTSLGTLTCTLRDDVNPIAVANFVGLTRGLRPWRGADSHWRKRRFYDGLLFHRVIPGFVIQGGDPLGTGAGGPGYMFADEPSEVTHVAGALAYANAGPDTNGSQFYVTEGAEPSLDEDFTVFGVCAPVAVVTAIAGVATDGDDRPLLDLPMATIEITRCAP